MDNSEVVVGTKIFDSQTERTFEVTAIRVMFEASLDWMKVDVELNHGEFDVTMGFIKQQVLTGRITVLAS